MKVYLAHAISTSAEFEDSKRVAERIRKLGYEVYVASENNAINDKSNNPTPIDIYDGDMNQLLNSDILVVNLNGGHQDGTISEIGAVAGWNESVIDWRNRIEIVGYTSNKRLLQPQFHKGVPSAHANHLVLGMVEKWGNFEGSEEDMLKRLTGVF